MAVYVNGIEIRVIGMSRSGSHAIIDWLRAQMDGRTCFLNCAEPIERARWVGRSRRHVDLLILRDPFNLFASRLAGRVGVLTPELAMRIWCQHARQFLGLRRYLRGDLVCVSYNAWASSTDHRRAIADALDLEFDDRAARNVPACAGGSSFDGLTHDGAASAMAVFDRWRAFADQRDCTRLFTREVRELAAAAFGDLPAADGIRPDVSIAA